MGVYKMLRRNKNGIFTDKLNLIEYFTPDKLMRYENIENIDYNDRDG